MAQLMVNGYNLSSGYIADEELNSTSINPVQNKVITEELNKKINASEIADWAKAENKPEYTYTEVGADPVGSASAAKTEANKYTDEKVADLVGSAPEILDTIEEVAAAIQENETVVEALEAAIGNKANKDEIPTSLPANGGNADTVNTQYQAPVTTGNTMLYPTLVDSNNSTAAAEAIKTNDSIKWQMKAGTTSTTGYAQLQLGNGIQEGTEGNMQGQLVFFGPHHPYYAILTQNNAQTENMVYHLPETGGTLALNSAASTSANGLMAKTDKAKLDNTNIAYGTCATAAATAAKVVTITGNTNWKLAVGSMIVVKFTNTSTASNCTLNVNNTGAKQIWYNNVVYTGNNSMVCGYANRYIKFMYDGTYWIWMGHSLDLNNWTAASATANGYVTTGAQTFAGAKTFNASVYPNGATAYGTPQARKMASGTAAASTTNCPSGAWYGQHS